MFATRLTRVTRALASRSPERAIQRAAAAAPDWSSGTRIGDALRAFNDRHGRRGMARGAVIVILSDGWERGEPALVGREMERLARLAYRIVWVNPRVSAAGFVAARRRHGGGAAARRRARQRPQPRRAAARSPTRSAPSAATHSCPSRAGARGGRAVGERDAGARQLGGDAERLRPEPRQDDARDGAPMTKICIYPGCERPAVPPHPRGRPAAGFCDLEEHNALTAHQERQRLRARGGASVADEAYRAVFLRVHPTGKMVLSLTTEADGNEGALRRSSWPTSSACPRSTSRSCPADENRFGSGHGFNTSPSGGTPAAIASATGKIRAKAQLLAGAALETPADGLRWDNGAFVGDGRRADDRRPRAVRARHRRAAARASRAGSTRRPSTATDDARSDPEQRRR